MQFTLRSVFIANGGTNGEYGHRQRDLMDWVKALNDEEDKLVKVRMLVCSDFSSQHLLNISVKQNSRDGSLVTYPTQLLLFPILFLLSSPPPLSYL